jgi:hypothetical protein
VGKPEGLSGGQTENSNLENNIPPSEENVNKVIPANNTAEKNGEMFGDKGPLFDIKDKESINNRGGQNEREGFTADAGRQERGNRNNVLSEVHQERERRVGVERQIISADINAPVSLRIACKWISVRISVVHICPAMRRSILSSEKVIPLWQKKTGNSSSNHHNHA